MQILQGRPVAVVVKTDAQLAELGGVELREAGLSRDLTRGLVQIVTKGTGDRPGHLRTAKPAIHQQRRADLRRFTDGRSEVGMVGDIPRGMMVDVVDADTCRQ